MAKQYLVPIGPIEAKFLGTLAERLEKSFNRPCLVAEGLPEPDYAFDRRRGQYRMEPILERLCRLKVAGAHRLLGLVDRDCYTSGLNFVFGQAVVRGREAVVALARLHQEFYGWPEDGELFFQRALKEAVHELGHTYGLGHCSDPGCVMYFSNSVADTDRKGAAFCPNCREALRLLEEREAPSL